MRNSFAALSAVIIALFFFTAEGGAYKTNANGESGLFEKEVEGRSGLEEFLKNSTEEARSEGSGKKAGEALGVSGSSVSEKAGELTSVSANNLESAGRAERFKEENSFLDSTEIDYSDPRVLNHKQDVDSIAGATEKLLARLEAGLREIGIDCKQAAGNKEIEPEFYIEVQKKAWKDTVYNKKICEERRNVYNCRDSLNLYCKRKGIKWGEWQNKEIHVPGGELVNSGKSVFWIHHVANSCFEYKLPVRFRGFGQITAVRDFLATKHKGATLDNIGPEVSCSWYGGIFSIDGWNYCGRILGSKDYAWSTYVIQYKYRDGSPDCLEWSAEDWTEACSLR